MKVNVEIKRIALLLTVVVFAVTIGLPVTADFSDIPQGSAYAGAVARVTALGIMTGTSDGRFTPGNIISREQFAVMVARAMGLEKDAGLMKGETVFSDIAPSGWSSGYINLLVSIGVLKGSGNGKFDPYGDITYGQAVTMLLRALGISEPDIKSGWPGGYILKAQQLGLAEGITAAAGTSLAKSGVAILLDNFWGVAVKKGVMSNMVITVRNQTGGYSTYDSGKPAGSPVLPDDIPYYHNGAKVDFEDLDSLMKADSSIVFGRNADKSDYTCGIVFDPVYGKSELAGSKGRCIVTDIQGKNAFTIETDNSVSGTITAILPETINPASIQIDNKSYGFSDGLKPAAVLVKTNPNTGGNAVPSTGTYKTGDLVTAVLDPAGKIIGLLPYKVIEATIVGNSQTSAGIAENQVQTDGGIYYLAEGIKPDLGGKYRFEVENGTISGVEDKLSETSSITVLRVLGSTVSYSDGTNTGSMTMPEKPKYYHNGSAIDYDKVNGLLQSDSMVIFTYNSDKTGYDSAVITDPVYGKPQVSSKWDVTYNVTDMNGNNGFSFTYRNVVTGIIENFLPNQTYPNALKIFDGSTYYFSKDMDFGKLSGFQSNYFIILILGYDGKIVDVRRS